MEDFRLDNIKSYSSTVKAAQRVLKEHKKKVPKDIDMHRIRVGKTTYCFTSKCRMNNKIKELDCEFDYAPPGQKLKP